ncbi:MAG TPA: xanthine dehydrogenase family protein subunit M [Burkholderiales bacterium]|jgi:carbon-monoxide dehydrogenase medium subunit|nr:xanthine dehydrogenase family protein subunit M [Burkholderiales bacterium]
MRRFEYHEPATLDEAVALLGRFGDEASLLAGGTDLLVEIREHVHWPRQVVNIKKIQGIAALGYDERAGLRFGALVTAREIETSPVVLEKYPGLAQAARELGSIQVRNRATIVGNVCRASPSADTLPPLIADGATVKVYGPAGERTVALEAFFTGPGTTLLGPGELVTEIAVPPPPPRTGKHYIKHGRRKAMELATVGVGVTLTLDGGACREIRIALGAVAPTPIRARNAEDALRGRALDGAGIEAAARIAMDECRPISNVRGSAEYRRDMVGVLTQRAIRQAMEAVR